MRILAIGYNTSGTGLTRVMHSIMRRLADRHEIDYLGIGYSGEAVRHQGLTIHPTNPRGGDVFAAFQAIRFIEEINPSLLFILHDIWTFEYYLRLLGPYRERLKIVAYIPIDGRIVNEEDAAPLQQTDAVVAYTDFARGEFDRAFHRLREERGGRDFPRLEVVPHGVDRERFHPFPELVVSDFDSRGRAGAKRRVFGDGVDPHNSFVVLNASRPDKRKRLDLTISGFAKFAADKPANVRLCLHQGITDEIEERRMESLIRQYGLGARVLFNPLAGGVVEDDDLNLIYNACDVGLNTSMGEGWGLASFEHAAAGAAQVVPDHTACSEIWRGRGELIPPVRSYVPEFSTLEMGGVSADGVARALEALYRDRLRHQRLAKAAFTLTQRPEYSWDSIASRFEELFVSLLT